jgi:hypothetical protein
MGVDPISMIAIGSAVAGLAGAGVNYMGSQTAAAGQRAAGQAQATTYEYQAEVAANNALIAKQNAAWTMAAGDVAASNKGLQTRAAVGTQKVQQGAAGIDVNTGSAATVRAGTESMGLLDAMTIRSNASRAAYGYDVKATSETAQAKLDRMAAGNAVTGANLQAQGTETAGVGSLLSGVSTVGGNWAKFQNVGGVPSAPSVNPVSTAATDPTYSNYGFGMT